MLNPPFKIALLSLLLGHTLDVQAAPEAFNFNLPAQPASSTLDQIARSSQTQLIYTDKSVQG